MNIPRPVPIEYWGRDHWSTLAYVETVCVDNKGRISLARMRCSAKRHPALLSAVGDNTGREYPTFLKEGELTDHDDWDCLLDMESIGYVKIHGGSVGILVDVEPGKRGPLAIRAPRKPLNFFNRSEIRYPPKVRITDKGAEMCATLRRHKSQGGNFKDFTPTPSS